MMVSNSVLLTNPMCSKRQNGARCSVEVINNIYGRMAQPSSSVSSPTEQDTDEDLDSPRSHVRRLPFQKPEIQRSPHPFSQAVGLLCDIEDFDVLEMLGEGFFCRVLKVRHKTTGEEMVLKVCKISAVGSRRTAHADAAREADMLRKLRHRNILAMKGICIERCGSEWDMHLLVDYCAGGSLSRYILDRSKHFPWQKRLRFALEISNAMEFLHSNKIIHRDLTSMNVLLRVDETTGETEAVVADFGLSCPFPKRAEKLPQVGTTYFMSPECLKEEFYDEKSDVFSFGVILCQLIARIDADPDSGLHRTSTFGLDYVLFTPCCPPDTPIEFLKIAFKCCLLMPSYRPSFKEISSFLREIASMIPSSPLSERQANGKESRLGRSRSDAALRRPKNLQLRKLSNTLATSYCRPVVEGVADDESSIAAMEELAHSIARDEPSYGHTNPFVIHERYRTERKIIPRTGGRRRSETKPEPLVEGQAPIKRWYRRRCASLPAEMDNESFALEGQEDEIDGSPGGIPMAFRDFDMKCSKSMKRFPSRRHTMIPECGVKSTMDLQSLPPSFEPSFSRSSDPRHESQISALSPVREALSDENSSSIPPAPLSLSSSNSSFHSLGYSIGIGDHLNNNVGEKDRRVCDPLLPRRHHRCVIL